MQCSQATVFTLRCQHLAQTQNNRWHRDINCLPFTSSVIYRTQLCTNGYRNPLYNKFYQLPLHLCLYYLYQKKRTPFSDSFWVKLPHLIIKHWDALFSTNDHIKCKNNIEDWQPKKLSTLIPENPNHLPWKYWCKIFFLILIYRPIKFMLNVMGYYWGTIGFSSGHVWMWELDCEEIWALKNGCF